MQALKSLFKVALPGVTLAALMVAVQSPAVSQASESVTVAIAGPLAGTSFSVGVQYKVGVTAALEILPDGMLLGRKVELSLHDDKCKKDLANKVALKLVEDPPEVVIGHSCSAATIAAAPVYAEYGVLQITPASTNPKVTGMGFETIFRMIGRDDQQGLVAAERIATRYADQKLGIMRFPGAYSTGLTSIALDELQSRGITVSTIVEGTASAASYAPEIMALMEAGVEVVYLVGGGLDSGVFLRQVDRMEAPFKVISSDTLVSRVFREAAGRSADGVAFTFPPEAARLATSAPAVAAIRALGSEPVGYTLLAYAAAEAWIKAVERAGSFDADKVAMALRERPVETILGEVSFDDQGDITTAYAPFAWYTWQDGKRVPVD